MRKREQFPAPKTSKLRQASKPKTRVKKRQPDTPPAPPPVEEKPDLTEALLLRLVSPLKSLPVQTAEAVIYLRPEDIAFAKTTENRRVLIYDVFGNEWQRFDLLSELEKRLDGDPRFFRAHKSFLVNVFAIKKLRKNPETGLFEVYFGEKVKGYAQVASGNMKALRERLEL